MGVSKTFSVIDAHGVPVKLPSGTYFCYNCSKHRKTIPYLCTGTIEPCKCGSKMVFTQE